MSSSEQVGTRLEAWKALEGHAAAVEPLHMRDLFARDAQRPARFSVRACGLLLDYSRNRITGETLRALVRLADERHLGSWIEKLFAAEAVNTTEGRPALHVALRRPAGEASPAGAGVQAAAERSRARMREVVDSVLGGRLRGFTGEPIRAVVNLGIGGSDLGAAMATRALERYAQRRVAVHFVSNVDSAHLDSALAGLDPRTTLFLLASKSFSTPEMLTNAGSARHWLAAAAGSAETADQWLAVTARPALAAAFGVAAENVLEIDEGVGGRYSVWSAMGLPLAIAVGMERFEELLAGAREMDDHFRSAPPERNLPVLLALLGIWYRNFLGTSCHGVFPYDYALGDFPAYLQQLEMESTGKRVTRDGIAVNHRTCPVVWGGLGNNGQHAFFQLLHQGTELIPSDFLVPVESQRALPGHESAVLANALAQTEALMRGRTEAEVREALAAAGLEGEALEEQVPHRVLRGNQPTNVLMYPRLTPRVLGSLMALYEHKVFVQGVIWGVNPFDQWGVELGKEIARALLEVLEGEAPAVPEPEPEAARELIRFIRECRAEGGRRAASGPEEVEA